MVKNPRDGRIVAAACMIVFHGSGGLAGGSWASLPVAALLAWALLAGNRAARALIFGGSALIGTFLAAGLARYALRSCGVLSPLPRRAPAFWLVYFSYVAAYCLTLATLSAPRLERRSLPG